MMWVKRTGICIGVLVLALGLYVGYLHLTGNIHEVIAGQFYRSGQLSTPELARVTEQYGIRTVINLRGSSPRQWYKDEVAETSRLGIKHVDFRMSASKELSLGEIRTLIALMRDAPKPLLIHCEGGADRSGLASAIYTSQIAGQSEDRAELQLSPLFGHFGVPYLTGSYKMDKTWQAVELAYGMED